MGSERRNVLEAHLTKNHIFLCVHHIMGPGEGLTQTSHVLRGEQTVLGPAVRNRAKRPVTDQYNSRRYYWDTARQTNEQTQRVNH